MTNKECAARAEHLMNGYRKSEVVKDNPDWEMIEFLDGFISHERLVQATIARRDDKVNSIKEDSHNSHCNQAFYQLVDKNDKNVAAETLAKQRKLIKFIYAHYHGNVNIIGSAKKKKHNCFGKIVEFP